jgi:hypothetical protein
VPILLAEADENFGSLMRYYGFLSRLGFELDLVIIIQDSGQYADRSIAPHLRRQTS